VLQLVPSALVQTQLASFQSPDPSAWTAEALLGEFVAKGWLQIGNDGTLVFTEPRLVQLKEAAETAAVLPVLNCR
jgi:hypothetical protein